MHLIERVGSYVGLASFLGLAILALLYFSQARDLRLAPQVARDAKHRVLDTLAAMVSGSHLQAGEMAIRFARAQGASKVISPPTCTPSLAARPEPTITVSSLPK